MAAKDRNNIIITCLLSRKWRIQAVADIMNEIDVGNLTTTFYVLIDNPLIYPEHIKNKIKRDNVIIRKTKNGGMSEMNVNQRRKRIASNMNEIKDFVKTRDDSYLFMFEDDTDFKDRTLLDLYVLHKRLSKKVKVGIMSGLQAGRWGMKMIGAWNIDNVKNPTVYETIGYNKYGHIEEVDATGLYCFITKVKTLRKINFRANHFGPDVHFGEDLRVMGYKNYVYWRAKTIHVTKSRAITVDDKCVKLRYIKNGNTFKLKKNG